jgi:predicted amidohydrolase YtcJ
LGGSGASLESAILHFSGLLASQQHAFGTIAAGKRADLVLLDRDVLTVSPEKMRDTKVVWTMVGGKTVYWAPN